MTVHVNWRQDAACRDADPELFFPVGTTGPALHQIRDARRICCGCPAQAPCLAWALDHGVTDGVWGGLYPHRATLAALLAPWFARRTVADLAAAFAGTSVPWVHADQVNPALPMSQTASADQAGFPSRTPWPGRGT